MPGRCSGPRILLCAPGADGRAVIDALSWCDAERQRAFDEVHVVVSATDRELVARHLLGPPAGRGAFARACARLGLAAPPYLSARTVHVVPDVRTRNSVADESALAPTADALWRVVRNLCIERRAEVDAIVASGAAEIGIVLAVMLQSTGSPAVRLFVPDTCRLADGRRGRIAYAEVPAVVGAADVSRDAEGSYVALVEKRRRELQRLSRPDPLAIDLVRRRIAVGGQEITLPRALFFWYALFAATAGQRLVPRQLARWLTTDANGRIVYKRPAAPTCRARACLRVLAAIHRAVYPSASDAFPAMVWRACGPHPLLPSIISKINARMKQALGHGAAPYLVTSGRNGVGYALALDRDRVRVVGLQVSCGDSPTLQSCDM